MTAEEISAFLIAEVQSVAFAPSVNGAFDTRPGSRPGSVPHDLKAVLPAVHEAAPVDVALYVIAAKAGTGGD